MPSPEEIRHFLYQHLLSCAVTIGGGGFSGNGQRGSTDHPVFGSITASAGMGRRRTLGSSNTGPGEAGGSGGGGDTTQEVSGDPKSCPDSDQDLLEDQDTSMDRGGGGGKSRWWKCQW